MNTAVQVGQIWSDNDARSRGRTLRVEHVGEDAAICRVLTPPGRVGHTTKISLRRFRPTSTGYALISDVGAQTEQGSTTEVRDRGAALRMLIAAFDAMPADIRPVELVNRDRAAKALDALAKAGMSVALPREPDRTLPDTPDEHGRKEWVTPIGEVTVFDDGEARIESAYHSHLTPADLRAFADVLYTAALDAEKAAKV